VVVRLLFAAGNVPSSGFFCVGERVLRTRASIEVETVMMWFFRERWRLLLALMAAELVIAFIFWG
jgi:hypothetical protein